MTLCARKRCCKSARPDARRGSRRRNARSAASPATPCRPPARPCPARRCRIPGSGPETLAERNKPGVENEIAIERDDALVALRLPRSAPRYRPGSAAAAFCGTARAGRCRPSSWSAFCADRWRARVRPARSARLRRARNPPVTARRNDSDRVRAVVRHGGGLHEGHALALHRVGDDDFRACRYVPASASSAPANAAKSWPSQRVDMPAESRELGFQIAEIARLLHADVGLQLVVVDDTVILSSS